jgi:hypothetical protein
MPVNACTGGTASPGVSSLTFVNNTQQPVTITSCTIPGWPATTPPPVPPENNGAPGSAVVQLASRTTAGTYTFTTSPACNTIGTNPTIRIQ